MKLIRIRMLKTRDQLQAGQFYNQIESVAHRLIEQGYAVGPEEAKSIGPSEIKPAEPLEFKAKKKRKRAATGSES